MAEEVGAGYVSLVPSLRGFSKLVQKELRKELRGVEISVPVKIAPEIDRKNLVASLTGGKPLKVPVDLVTRGGLGKLLGLHQGVKVDIDEADFRTRMARLLGGRSTVTQKVSVQAEVDKDQAGRSATEAGAGASRLFTSAFGSSLLNPLIGIPAVAAAALLAIPASAAVAAATLAGAGLGAIFVGAFGLRNDTELQTAVKGMLGTIDKTITEAAQPLKGPFLEAIKIVSDAVVELGPDLKGLFTAIAPAIPELARGLAGFLKAFGETGALEKLGKAALPVLNTLAASLPDLGNALAQFLISMSEVSPQASDFLGKFLRGTADAIRIFGDVISFLSRFLGPFITIIKWVVERIDDTITGMLALRDAFNLNGDAISKLGGILNGWLTAFVDWIISVAKKIRDGVSGAISGMVTNVKQAPGKILGALGNVGTMLLDAGRNIVQGLIDGIKSRFGALGDIASNMAGIIRSYLPFSPAKEGPLSGSGNPYHSGEVIAGDVARGMQAKLPSVTSAGDRLAAAVGGSSRTAGGAAPATPTLRIAGDGSRIAEALIEILKEAIRELNGGNVDLALGT